MIHAGDSGQGRRPSGRELARARHDLHNHLGVVVGNVSLLLMEPTLTLEDKRALEDVVEATRKIRDLFDAYLTLSEELDGPDATPPD